MLAFLKFIRCTIKTSIDYILSHKLLTLGIVVIGVGIGLVFVETLRLDIEAIFWSGIAMVGVGIVGLAVLKTRILWLSIGIIGMGIGLVIAGSPFYLEKKEIFWLGIGMSYIGAMIAILKSLIDAISSEKCLTNKISRILWLTVGIGIIGLGVGLVKAGPKIEKAVLVKVGSEIQQIGLKIEEEGLEIEKAVLVKADSEIQQVGSKIEEKGLKIKEAGSEIQQVGSKIEEKGSEIQQVGSKIEEKGSEIQQVGSEIKKADVETLRAELVKVGLQIEEAGSEIQQGGSEIKKAGLNLINLIKMLWLWIAVVGFLGVTMVIVLVRYFLPTKILWLWRAIVLKTIIAGQLLGLVLAGMVVIDYENMILWLGIMILWLGIMIGWYAVLKEKMIGMASVGVAILGIILTGLSGDELTNAVIDIGSNLPKLASNVSSIDDKLEKVETQTKGIDSLVEQTKGIDSLVERTKGIDSLVNSGIDTLVKLTLNTNSHLQVIRDSLAKEKKAQNSVCLLIGTEDTLKTKNLLNTDRSWSSLFLKKSYRLLKKLSAEDSSVTISIRDSLTIESSPKLVKGSGSLVLKELVDHNGKLKKYQYEKIEKNGHTKTIIFTDPFLGGMHILAVVERKN